MDMQAIELISDTTWECSTPSRPGCSGWVRFPKTGKGRPSRSPEATLFPKSNSPLNTFSLFISTALSSSSRCQGNNQTTFCILLCCSRSPTLSFPKD